MIEDSITVSYIERLYHLYVNNPVTATMFIATVGSTYFIIKERSRVLDFIKNIFLGNTRIRRKLNRDDLLKHQIFKDIELKLDYSINQAYDPENRETKCDPGKTAIAREILTIQLRIIRDWLTDFVKTTDFDSEYVDVRTIFRHKYNKSLSAQYYEYKNSAIPKLVIDKFLEINKIPETYLLNSLDDILSEKISLGVYEKVMIILANFNVYINAAFMNMQSVLDSINGDLHGTRFKNYVIGGTEYNCYPVPDKKFIPQVKIHLRQLLSLTRACRCCVCVFHDYEKDNYLQGFFSKIYEYYGEGLSSILTKFQFLPAAILGNDMITSFKQHKMYTIRAENMQGIFKELINGSNISILCAYPIFFSGELRGFLEVCYSSEETFCNMEFDDIETCMKECCGLINIYVNYDKGLNYDNNHISGLSLA